jgi:hypothetical protein
VCEETGNAVVILATGRKIDEARPALVLAPRLASDVTTNSLTTKVQQETCSKSSPLLDEESPCSRAVEVVIICSNSRITYRRLDEKMDWKCIEIMFSGSTKTFSP